MLAETRGTGPVGPGPPWRPSTSAKNLGTCQRQQGGKYRRQASGQKSCFFGLETRPELVWEDWDHGREFTKTLVLKNIHSKLQKLNIRPPVSTVFSVTSPETIVLSQGTSFLLPVTFRPLQKCEYEDSIEFQCKEGSFQVCLRAIVPCHALEVPDSVMLPLCAVQHSTHTTFLLRNSSKLQTCFQWECAAPFQLSPEQGLLKPGNECHITVVFQPQEAQLYQQQVYCRFGEEVDKAVGYCTVLLQALAKYPYLQLRNPSIKEGEEHSDPVLCFGCVAIGKSLQKHFDIINPSPVTASFSLSQLSNGIPLCGSEFTCDISRGKVAPGGMVHATVTYSPAAVDTVSVEYLSLKYKGALNETLLKLTGKCIGPTVSLSSSVLDFGCVEEGGSIVQTVELVNSSPVEACYQWDIDCCGNSVFHILPASGTVLPHSHATLKAVYRPMHPMAHYRRVPCLILYRDPVFLDLIGTCHSELQQPAILKPEHLVEYKLHWHHREHSSDTLSGMQQDHIAMNQQESPTPLDESNPRVDSAPVLSTTPMGELYQTSLGCMDPLSSQRSSLSSLHVSVEPNELLFNHKITSSLCTSSVSSQSVSLKNHTGGKLSLVWTVAQDSPFSISPSSCDLAPLKSTSFRVTYNPKQLNTLHGAQLECFAYYKDSQGIGEQVPCPPRCVTVRVIGHSFQPGKEHFIPSCTLKPPQVVFPALSVISYRTVLLQNNGDLPLTFFLDHSSKVGLAESVFIVPSCGLIQPGRHQILTLRTIPTEDCPKQGFNLCLQLNAAKLTKELTVLCVAEKPRVSLEGGCTLYFQTTAVGSQSQRAHRIRNFSRLPVRFKWSIPEPDQELIFVEPDAGELHPNESSVQTWSFIPLAEKTYTVKPTLTFWPSQTDGSNKSHISLKVVGKGSMGTIEAERAVLDVGEALIGSNRSIEIPLVNNSPCPVSFCLSVEQNILDGELSNDPKAESSALQLDCMRATIASNSTMKLQSTVKPQRRTQYLWTISYQTLNANGSASSSPQALCEVRVKGVFPTLQVIDACGGGSVGRLSKVHLWKLFSLHRLNEFLLSSPSPAELTFRTPTRHSLRSCPSVFTKAVLDFNFSLAPLNSDPSNIVLMFHNPGSVPVDWAFLFPADQQIELEYWTETGEFTSTDLYQMKVQENQLFSVSPRSGTLLPGQKRAVHFSYRHDFAGTDRFPVVFKLSHGREILLSLQGLTVERDRPYLHFASYQHVFTSVTIGDCNPPRQVYKLHNGGAVPVHYEVDTGVLSQLHVDNFNHPVLCCLSPVGEVLPGKTAMLEWIFSPLEAKTYHVDVPIHIQDGDTTLVKFKGCGIDTPTLGFLNTQSGSKVSGPCDQKVPFPGQVLFLSEDSVCLGDIPVCSRSSRILFLTNVSYTDTVHYTWDLPQPGNQQVVQIHPEGGHVRPGECVLCVLTFTSTDYPTIYQLDLVCQVTREAALTLYHEALQRWEEERDAQQDELVVRDKNVTQSQRVLIDKEPLATPTRKGPPLRKYKTLPPICASSSCETVGSICTKLTRAERRAQRATTRVRKRPVPPQPALLHLEVTAHSHGRQEYLTHFPDQFSRHNRYLQSVKTQPPQTTCSSASLDRDRLPTPTRGPEKDILVHIFASMLRDILDDSAFVQSLVTVASKPIIYRPRETPSQPPSLPKSSSSPIPRVPADMSEYVLMNTLQNLMMEAVRGELVLTSHPRTIILPPVSTRSRRTSNAMAGEEKP
ncbi:cilia- and flagella-associated protein 65 isoform X2 [Mugil cephalus]|uniref:cilia- and flagella-associated protein 65 isoform X2 n=1 Tax=Mugil cephalus TaxID=48193 RepID=UPI001FB69C66|nr:cilia- and flagella-associated protein 65 isoform X2 [Mugil cephalus]